MKSLRRIFLLVLSTALCAASCTFATNAQTSFNETIVEAQVYFPYVIYPINKTHFELAEVVSFVEKRFPELDILTDEELPDEFTGNFVLIESHDNLPPDALPPDVSYLDYFGYGLSTSQKKALQKTKSAISFAFFSDQASLFETTKVANEIVATFSKKDFIIWDAGTRQAYTTDAWNEMRAIDGKSLDMSQHLSMHFYQEGEFCRIISLGMAKFGLPDICIDDLSCNSSEVIYSLISLTAQTLYEKKQIAAGGKLTLDIDAIENKTLRKNLLSNVLDNGNKKSEIILKETRALDGDPENIILRLQFSNENPQIEHDDLLSTIFGFEDVLVHVTHEEELMTASNNAKKRIPELKEIFAKSKKTKDGTVLLMKYYFSNDEGDGEWMWVEITEWNDNETTGLLQNEPYYVKSLKSGQKVKNEVDGMFDYILYHPDGTEEGNKTTEILMKSR